MKTIIAFLFAVFVSFFVSAQCDFDIPELDKKILYAGREFSFSGVEINGEKVNYAYIKPGDNVEIKVLISSVKKRNFCPNCIVQVYWGINKYTSVCVSSFQGYNMRKTESSLTFKAPKTKGVYYVTMGGSLEYSCKNDIYKPFCKKNKAFAVIKVGESPDNNKISLLSYKEKNNTYLLTDLQGQGCFGKMEKIQWYYNGEKLIGEQDVKIKLYKAGQYKVVWSNCNDSIHKVFDFKPIKYKDDFSNSNKNNMQELIQSGSNSFILKDLIFDQGKSFLKQKAKQQLDTLVAIMFEKPNLKILLKGYTDYRGRARVNKRLSYRRVKSARKYLISKGVSKSRVKIKGYGEKEPLIIDPDIKKCIINRRIELEVL